MIILEKNDPAYIQRVVTNNDLTLAQKGFLISVRLCVGLSERPMCDIFAQLNITNNVGSSIVKQLRNKGYIVSKRAKTQHSSRFDGWTHIFTEPKDTFYVPEKTESLKRGNKQVVYVMLDRVSKLYKIGVSSNPKIRQKQLAVSTPKIKLLFSFEPKSVNAMQAELAIHKMFDNKRSFGEWFDLTKEDVEYIKNLEI